MIPSPSEHLAEGIPTAATSLFQLIAKPLSLWSGVGCRLIDTPAMRSFSTIGANTLITIDWSAIEQILVWYKLVEPDLMRGIGAPAPDSLSSNFDAVLYFEARARAHRAFAVGDYKFCQALMLEAIGMKKAIRDRRQDELPHGFAGPLDWGPAQFLMSFLLHHEYGHIIYDMHRRWADEYLAWVFAAAAVAVRGDDDGSPIIGSAVYREDIERELENTFINGGTSAFGEEIFADHFAMACAFSSARAAGLLRSREGLLLAGLFGLPMLLDLFDVYHRRAFADPDGEALYLRDIATRWYLRAVPFARMGLSSQEAFTGLFPWSLPYRLDQDPPFEALHSYDLGIAQFMLASHMNPQLRYYGIPGEHLRKKVKSARMLDSRRIASIRRRLRSI